MHLFTGTISIFAQHASTLLEPSTPDTMRISARKCPTDIKINLLQTSNPNSSEILLYFRSQVKCAVLPIPTSFKFLPFMIKVVTEVFL